MEELLGNMYCWFESFFGQNLGEYCWGWQDTTQDYTGVNLFNLIGLTTLIVSAVVMVVYYYFPLNHPRFNTWWSWLIMLALNAVINLFIGYNHMISDLDAQVIPDSLMYERNPETGEIVNTLITSTECWGFGVANIFVSMIFFVLLSFAFKWWSSNCKHSPCL